MKDLFMKPTREILYPVLLVGLILFIYNTPTGDLLRFIEFFLPDPELISNFDWKAFR